MVSGLGGNIQTRANECLRCAFLTPIDWNMCNDQIDQRIWDTGETVEPRENLPSAAVFSYKFHLEIVNFI